ncbi:kinesin-like protein KIF25 isoform X3 [Latimeria chalumnae]|uniref:kinesin-like protein KIF25 isoform X3 n=1 Tax=Latimeria chalumnae TaxID=7897 RepID=UPI00313B5F08
MPPVAVRNLLPLLEQRVKQLECKLRGKEERIAALETENALLHLKLAECYEAKRKSNFEAACIQQQYEDQKNFNKTIACQLPRFSRTVKLLKKDLRTLYLLTANFSREVQQQSQRCLHQILPVFQRMQSHNLDMQKLQARAFELERCFQEVTERYDKEKHKRKLLHNTLVELRGNIRVHCRIRPFLPFDAGDNVKSLQDGPEVLSQTVIHAIDEETVCVKYRRPGHPPMNKKFEFERVYRPEDQQESVFNEVCPLLTSLLDGYNVCIMAYGQTGSGKTHTMLGPHFEDEVTLDTEPQPEEGIIPRAMRELFRLLSEKPSGSHLVSVSVVEVYNNEIFDLLAKDSCGTASGIKRDVVTTAAGNSDVPLLKYECVENVIDILHVISQGLRLRSKHPTLVHAHSSRSHLVVTLTITSRIASSKTSAACLQSDQEQSVNASRRQLPTVPQSSDSRQALRPHSPSPTRRLSERTQTVQAVKSKLQLVDLAGSECVGMSGVTGAALRETSFINRSLSALSDVLGALAEQRPHIPYRNSKLTHLLQDSIGT